MNKVRVLFAGSGSFAIPILQRLIASDNFEVVGVVTQPLKPANREQVLTPSALEEWMRGNSLENMPIFRPERLSKESETILAATYPDIFVVAAYGQMVPTSMLEFSKLGAVNFHGSLLPLLRGAVPVQMAILQGLKETGVTLQKMVKDLDAGPVIDQQKIELNGLETTDSLMQSLGNLAAGMLDTSLLAYAKGDIEPIEQQHDLATFCFERDIAKEKAQILPETDAATVDRMVRAFNPWPIAWGQFKINNSVKRLKIFTCALVDENKPTENSQIESAELNALNHPELTVFRRRKSLFINLNGKTLELLELQLEGKARGSASDYLYLDGALLVE